MLMQDIGCIACYTDGHKGVAADLHHILTGGRRTSHSEVIPLCPWHHRGVSISGCSDAQMEAMMGPSLALNKRRFVWEYGNEWDLLDLTNNLLEALL